MWGSSRSVKNRCCNDKDKNIYENFIYRLESKSQSNAYMDISNFTVFKF